MKKLLLLLLPFFAKAQTTLTFTQLAAADVPSYGRGAEVWIHRRWDQTAGQGVNMPAGNSTYPATNFYTRFEWAGDIEGATLGSYTWTAFDTEIHRAMDNHQMFSFRVMSVCVGCGGIETVPLYVKTQIEADADPNLRGYTSGSSYIPNWNNPYFHTRYTAMLNAVKAHINATSYQPAWAGAPIQYSKVIWEVDIGEYGNYGEWHQFPWVQDAGFPNRMIPTQAVLDSYIESSLSIFPDNQAEILIACFGSGAGAAGTKYEPPSEVAYRALTRSNNWGFIGWRRDNWGDAQYSSSLENNSRSYNGVALNTLIMNTWKGAPITGEPLQSAPAGSCGSIFCDLLPEVNRYHATGVGNGNFGAANAAVAAVQLKYQNAMNVAGYRLILNGGTMTTTLSPSGNFNVTLVWNNIGIAPVYENWTVKFELRDHTTHAVAFTGTSTFNPRLLLPGTLSQSDNFTLGAIATGTYDLFMGLIDPRGYKLPLTLAITGRAADGYYPIRTNITVSGSSSVPPVAQAGGTYQITLPVSTTSLNGSTSFANGGASIVSYSWTNISGPNTPTITSPTASITPVSGLIQGTYKVKLTVTDNNALTDVDTATIIVNAPNISKTSIFTTQTPSGGLLNDGQGVSLGMKFRSTVDAYVTGAGFYKVLGNNGVHIGELYTSAGVKLASAQFSNETTSGWQTVTFTVPVFISKNTTYIISYFSPLGLYAEDNDFFTTALVNGTLTALANGTDGPQSVYKYASTPSFPTDYFSDHKANYWVDVIVATNVPSSCGPNCLPGRRFPLKVKNP